MICYGCENAIPEGEMSMGMDLPSMAPGSFYWCKTCVPPNNVEEAVAAFRRFVDAPQEPSGSKFPIHMQCDCITCSHETRLISMTIRDEDDKKNSVGWFPVAARVCSRCGMIRLIEFPWK